MKRGHVQIDVRQYADGRWGFDDYSRGHLKKVRLKTKLKADARAQDVAVLLANGRRDLLEIDPKELAVFRAWRSAAKTSIPLRDAIRNLLKLKESKSSRTRQSLRRDLGLFESFIGRETLLSSITAPQIQAFIDSRKAGLRRQFNLRAATIQLFRWARRQRYLPDTLTEAERVEPIERKPGQVHVLSPAELETLIDNVSDEFLPWLVIGSFTGIRSEEIAPPPDSNKSPLAWGDIDWRNKTITVRAETSKTKEERDVPMSANLIEWLAPWRNATGPICHRQPSKRETSRIGEFIGGWEHNALRDSFCSYRARITQNIPQVSYEMGNSIAMVKRSYHKRQPKRPARQWFSIRPKKARGILPFPKKVPNSSKFNTSIAAISHQR